MYVYQKKKRKKGKFDMALSFLPFTVPPTLLFLYSHSTPGSNLGRIQGAYTTPAKKLKDERPTDGRTK